MQTRTYGLVWTLALGLALAVSASYVPATTAAKAPTWITTRGKTVNLTLIAAYDKTASGFNFNGGAHGALTITVPQGDTVIVTFSNLAPLPHSAEIVANAKTPSAVTSFTAAFKGASTPNPSIGSPAGRAVKFSFTADKAGTYLLVCAVPGHVAAGMWDYFVVSGTVTAGTITTSK